MPRGIVTTRAERPRRSTKIRNELVSIESRPGKKATGRRLEREAQQHPALQLGARTPKVAREQRQANAHDSTSTQRRWRQKVLPKELRRDGPETEAKRASAGDGLHRWKRAGTDTAATSGRETACYPLVVFAEELCFWRRTALRHMNRSFL